MGASRRVLGVRSDQHSANDLAELVLGAPRTGRDSIHHNRSPRESSLVAPSRTLSVKRMARSPLPGLGISANLTHGWRYGLLSDAAPQLAGELADRLASGRNLFIQANLAKLNQIKVNQGCFLKNKNPVRSKRVQASPSQSSLKIHKVPGDEHESGQS
jgi:hypothetical protein